MLWNEIMNKLKAVMNCCFVIAAVAAVISFAMPFRNASTDQAPDGGAGTFAPIVAVCVAAMIFAEAVRSEGLQIRWIPGICIGLGSLGSAYLWMAAENDAHPLDPELPVTLAVLFGIAAVMVAVPMTIRGTSKSGGKGSDD